MDKLYAKSIIDDKFWIVENNGTRFATLRKNEDNKFVMSNEFGMTIYQDKETLKRQFGEQFFSGTPIKSLPKESKNEIHGYLCNSSPHNAIYDIKRKIPLYSKSADSKSLYCAGYYVIRFDKGWVKSFCPKLITLQRYPYKGPFKTEIEMKQVLANVSR